MRYLLASLLLLFSIFQSVSQEEADGRWYLETFTLGGEDIELGSFTTPVFRILTGDDDEGSVSGRASFCISYSADIVVTEDTFVFSDVSLFDNSCTSSEEIEFKNMYYEFLFGDISTPLNFIVNGVEEDVELVITNESGDQAKFGIIDPLIPNALVQEPWYVSHMEIDGEILEYPPYEEVREGLHIISYFDNPGGIGQGFICQAGGGTNFGAYQDGANQIIDIKGMTLLAQNCGPSLALNFDNTFINQIENKIHTYEILEEGQGRRLTLTDENGDRIFYTNAFLAPKDPMLDGIWYFDSLLVEDVLFESPEDSLPFLIIDSETELWNDNAACNSYTAHYSTTQNTLTLQNFNTTDVTCSTDQQTDFEDFYLDQFITVNEALNEFDYDLNVDTDGNRTLTLTDLSTDAIATYTTKHPFIPSSLEENWTLTSLENNDVSIDIPEDAFSTFTIDVEPESSIYLITDNCAQYGGVMSITESEMIINEYNEALDACMESSAEPQALGNSISDFYGTPTSQTLSYEILDEDNIATRQLLVTKENGDQATYGARFSETLVALTNEPWYLDFYEIGESTFDYPPQDDLQYEDFTITTFDTQGDIQQQLTCWNPTSSTFEVIDNEENLQIQVGGLSVMTPNCGASAPFNFDNLFIGQFSNHTHSVEIVEEGQGRRLILTDENGNRIFYTNAFLNIKDIDAKSAIAIYPNPADETLFISTTAPSELLKIEVYNLQGQRVLQSDFRSQIDISDLAQGLYLIKFNGETQESVHQFIKK